MRDLSRFKKLDKFYAFCFSDIQDRIERNVFRVRSQSSWNAQWNARETITLISTIKSGF